MIIQYFLETQISPLMYRAGGKYLSDECDVTHGKWENWVNLPFKRASV